jgi:hypothetical protein
MGVNFRLVMRDERGHVVPGSERNGHNTMTAAGRDLLTQLLVWSSITNPDAAYTSRRARYIGLGGGIQVEDQFVVALVLPLQVTAGVYLKALNPTLTVFTTETSVTVKTIFATTDVTYAVPAVVVSEAGLYFDVSPGGVLSVSSASNVPSFYKTFSPVVKLDSFTMEISWDLKF